MHSKEEFQMRANFWPTWTLATVYTDQIDNVWSDKLTVSVLQFRQLMPAQQVT